MAQSKHPQLEGVVDHLTRFVEGRGATTGEELGHDLGRVTSSPR